MAEARSGIETGALLDGRLRVRRVLGRGAMGIVVEAFDETLSRSVAVKVMRADEHAPPATPELRARFAREARAVAALTSEHALHIYEIGELPDTTPFLVTELLDGTTLEALLRADGPAPVKDVVRWIAEATLALREAHALGLVHRDLKPENLFLARRNAMPSIVKVIDFGIVKDASPSAQALTKTGEGFGSPAYMSPEQVAGSDVDARSDVWSLGVCLFELLTGELPFAGSTVAKILWSVLNTSPPRVLSRRRDVPETLDAIVARCLEKDRALRWANAAELGAALAAVSDATDVGTADTQADVRAIAPVIPGDPRSSPRAPLAAETRDRSHQEAAAHRTSPQEAAPHRTEKRTHLAYVFATSVLAVLVVGMVIFIVVWTKSRDPVAVAPAATASSFSALPDEQASSDEADRTMTSAPASASAPESASASASASARGLVSVKKSTLRSGGSFAIELGAGSGELRSPSPEVVEAISRCGRVHRCPPKSRVRMRLRATEVPLGTLPNRDEPNLCGAAMNCVLGSSEPWHPICPPKSDKCSRSVDIVF